MKIKFRHILFTTVVSLLFSGCNTIEEDRSDCPCWLSIDVSHVDKSVANLHLWFFDNSGALLYRDTLYPEEYAYPYRIEIKRDMITYHAWGNIGRGTILDDNLSLSASLTKTEDVSADSLYSYSGTLSTIGETATDTIILNKEFATVDITLLSVPQQGDDIYLELYCSTAGRYIDRRYIAGTSRIRVDNENTGTKSLPIKFGPPTVELWAPENTHFSFRLIRQEEKYVKDMSMTLFAVHDNKESIIATLPFGEWLLESGYDMTAQNMEDINMTLDLSLNYVTVTIDNWQTTVPADITI